jgi:hypothetical protein
MMLYHALRMCRYVSCPDNGDALDLDEHVQRKTCDLHAGPCRLVRSEEGACTTS